MNAGAVAGAATAVTRAGHPRFHQIIGEIQDLHDRKNRDYTGGDASRPLGNFERVAAWMRLYPKMNWATPENVAMIYAMKQLDAALVLRESGIQSVTGEPITNRLRDVAVYSMIQEVIEWEKTQKQQPAEPAGLYPGEPEDKKVHDVWLAKYGQQDILHIQRDTGMSYNDLMQRSKKMFDGRYPTQLTVGEFRRLVKTAGVW